MDFQITDAVPLDDGSLTTQLVDDSGNVVATVTRMSDGTSTADVRSNAPAFDLSSIFGKVTGFLDAVAHGAQTVGNEAQRISNATRGAVTGARVGYNTPLNWTPVLIAAGVALVVGIALSPRRRR